MTASTQFKILEVLEPALGRQKATEFTELIEDIVDAKFQDETKMLTTKEDLNKTSVALKEDLNKTSVALREDLNKTSTALREDLNKTSTALREELHKTSVALKEDISKVSERLEGRIWTAFITLAVMILGLYATIIFRH